MTPKFIGILAPYLHGHFNAAVVRGVQRSVQAVGYHTMFLQYTPEEVALTGLAADTVAGWVAIAKVEGIAQLAARSPTVAVCGGAEAAACLNIMPDNAVGTRAAIEHLLALGHTQIGCLLVPTNVDFVERYQTYCAVLREHGIEPDPQLYAPMTGYMPQEAHAAMTQLLARAPTLTALFVTFDDAVRGVYTACAAVGRQVPDQLAVVSFDDIAEAAAMVPPLTTVQLNAELLGEAAGAQLLALIAGHGRDQGVLRIPTSLMIRESSGAQVGAVARLLVEPAPNLTAVTQDRRNGVVLSNYYRQVLETETYVMRALLTVGDVVLERLDWLAPTGVDYAALSLWDQTDGPDNSTLLLRGGYARAGQAPQTTAALSARTFPWPGLLPPHTAHLKAAPIRTPSRDWGLFSYAAPLAEPDYDGGVVWSTMIGLALEREQLLESLVEHQATLAVAYDRERMLAETVRDLGCPIIPLMPGVLLVPLIGAIDAARANQIMELVLAGVGTERARRVLIDITGVPIVDTEVAAALIRLTQAVRLLGASITLVGVRPEIAQSIVQLGIDLGTLETQPTLAAVVAQLRR